MLLSIILLQVEVLKWVMMFQEQLIKTYNMSMSLPFLFCRPSFKSFAGLYIVKEPQPKIIQYRKQPCVIRSWDLSIHQDPVNTLRTF
jgi:hypothetical protein